MYRGKDEDYFVAGISGTELPVHVVASDSQRAGPNDALQDVLCETLRDKLSLSSPIPLSAAGRETAADPSALEEEPTATAKEPTALVEGLDQWINF